MSVWVYNPRMSCLPWVTMLAASVAADYMNPISQAGEPGYRAVPKHHFRGMFENDSAFGEDRNYSHGSRFDYAQQILPNHYWGISLTQNIYTPEVHTGARVWGQHPYAGYLAIGGAYLYKGEDVGSSLELQLGTTGKPSFAENSQWFVHTVGNMQQWDGWADQIPAEPTVQLSARQDWRLAFCETESKGGFQTDGMIFTREAVGTVAISGGAGIVLRWGVNLPDAMQVNGNQAANYGVGLLRKSTYDPTRLSWFVVGSVYGEYVAHDLFIDGGVFHDFEQTCSRKPWQAEVQLGLGVAKDGIHYYAGGIWHTVEYRTQDHHSLYGTFSISWNW